MIVIQGDISCIGVEENLLRFLNTLEWCNDHKCVFSRNSIILFIKEYDSISEYDDDLDLEIEYGKIYNFRAVCQTCGKKAKSNWEDQLY